MTYPTNEQLARTAVGTGMAGEPDEGKLARLISLLSIKRPANGDGETAVAEAILAKYPAAKLYTDPSGNALAIVVTVGGGSKSLMSCHLDTVHGRDKAIRPVTDDMHINKVRFDSETNMLHADGDVLGADDGAGIWMLLEMVDAGVPASYIFHFSEECGGIGSTGMAKHHYKFLQGFDRAIAFDRKGVHSVITHQGWSRCCSDDFAEALAEGLSDDKYFFALDDGGVFTDTSNYTYDIGECTNVSVGYYSEHTSVEKLDLEYLFNLRAKCITLDWEALPTKRKPGEHESKYSQYNFGGTYKGMQQDDYDKEFEYYTRSETAGVSEDVPRGTVTPGEYDDITVDDLYYMDFHEIMEMIEEDPYVGAALIWEVMHGSLDSSGGAQDDDEEDDATPPTNDDPMEKAVEFIDRLRLKAGLQ